ncbi:carbohydrate sulfotransferase 11 [Cephus cinctus]|uniref:Carbohydrate sulfotransferase n=1 Tax=Cephus cinctus TaxID=211228 RepID=A0AAJ7RBK7_CEPCN|nr:carbohydrate sulfotransferase 11 [Cephus cinctus]XP_015588113.1 carbohydrate sulfotransferase 11 [Cephus cinctus]XP_015588115.1 carbohydrate sulfotransferase 11 [Cephus cinctus]XP_015588116.1 carbohydrate sulfotransferase 11 [Cephus cinctus]XP_024937470.1 carbohydrate sulfotransferase 11 [Cephus cinctus]XP_024937471.1 carbohydrate sulfotransferase 11 [Cephus cinctus]
MTRWSVARVLTTFEMYSLIFVASRSQAFASSKEERVLDLDFQNSNFSSAMTIYSLAGPNALARSGLVERQEKLQQHCEEIPDEEIHKRDVLPEMFHHILVDEKHKLLYCYVPKVACTNWKRVFMIVTGKWEGNDPLEIPANQAHAAGNLERLSNYSMPEIEEKLATYNKFIVVRHPLERLLSAYRNKFETKQETSSIYFQTRFGKKIVKKYRKNATKESLLKGDDVTFSEFVDFVTGGAENETHNEHWRSIYELCHPCIVNYNLVSKYESLTEDATEILERLGAGWVRFPTKPQSRESTSKKLDRYYSSLSLKQLQKLTDLYRLDLRLFDYSLEDVLGFSLA